MRVRMNRTMVVPVEGVAGLPSKRVRPRTTLTVGCGYDLPASFANDLIKAGDAARVVLPRKVSENELREAKQARAALRKAEQHLAKARTDIEDLRGEVEAGKAEADELRAALESATAELEELRAAQATGETPSADGEDTRTGDGAEGETSTSSDETGGEAGGAPAEGAPEGEATPQESEGSGE